MLNTLRQAQDERNVLGVPRPLPYSELRNICITLPFVSSEVETHQRQVKVSRLRSTRTEPAQIKRTMP